jgi:hypothetical protein
MRIRKQSAKLLNGCLKTQNCDGRWLAYWRTPHGEALDFIVDDSMAIEIQATQFEAHFWSI